MKARFKSGLRVSRDRCRTLSTTINDYREPTLIAGRAFVGGFLNSSVILFLGSKGRREGVLGGRSQGEENRGVEVEESGWRENSRRSRLRFDEGRRRRRRRIVP